MVNSVNVRMGGEVSTATVRSSCLASQPLYELTRYQSANPTGPAKPSHYGDYPTRHPLRTGMRMIWEE